MKSLGVTVLLLLCVLVLSFLNYHYVNDAIKGMNERMDKLPDIHSEECVAHVREIDDYWRSKEAILEMTISYPLIDRVCEQASLLRACANAKDAYGFYSARALLLDALEDLARSERICPGTLF
ncbi:MAG: DUF4363 family protein [Ruminococcaceae bacterium]|nr:DUF4363 family protein [Oscillospiraceae bacterium]